MRSTTLGRKLLVAAGVVAGGLLILRLGGPLVVSTRAPEVHVRAVPGDSKTLVVVAHGFGGASRPGLEKLAKAAFPKAHLIAPTYNSGLLKAFSNCSPYDIADVLETEIDSAFRRYHYEHIVLIGHSMGGELLRKVYLWGAGQEEDRPARRGRHDWVDRVERFVSLASINRGWSLDPAPPNMPWYRRAEFAIGTMIAKLTGTGRLIHAVERGSPFVADSRVQWIRLARQGVETRLPLVIHLLGTRDDIATVADIKDAQAAKDFKFKSLPNTGHADIATALAEELNASGPTTDRARTIFECVTKPADQLKFDAPEKLIEDPRIRRIVVILHGIRDYDVWGTSLKRLIEEQPGLPSDTVVLVPQYGYFPMAPFLLWRDRQEKVRWFMDYYTERLAEYPQAKSIDFIGHSNGTYILASALQKYHTLKVDDVYFAGSVVPQRYRWLDLVQHQRVHRVRNVVATSDWVVGFFPRLYEQVAEWRGIAEEPGSLDIGAAGFRGFRDAGLGSSGVRNIEFARGTHSTGVDLNVERKREALVRFGRYGLDADQDELFQEAFREATTQDTLTDTISNVCWLVWGAILALVAAGATLLWKWKWYLVIPYMLIVLGVLNSL
jgi:pimeloyl-ACP methyl ester carboxylesterase